MDKMIAFYGLTCTECLAFIATEKDDDIERKSKIKKIFRKEGFLLVIENNIYKESFYENTSCLPRISRNLLEF